ncbi:LAME_0A05798g1_1 [Lachancea meyersii CBS 8951]|uniref:LAME_0A05798g1_1 n=1 Tax=Lachancea meyersii CBS 8951 TaxID=1266667 RepID=A0A1G4IPW5_9SACH|nr:LAME_0A05798g1_1 [Lachancea meyersii CBS 8951]
MGKTQAIEFGIKRIPVIIPLDEESARQLCEQILTTHANEPDKVAEKFLEILGPEDESLNFVLQFNEKLGYKEPSIAASEPIVKNEAKNSGSKAGNDILEPLKVTKTPVNTKSVPPKATDAVRKSVLSSYRPQQNSPKPSVQEKPKKNGKSRKLQNLQEIDDVLKILELETTDKDPTKYVCNCRGTRHPLFEVAPNCLSCGKIMCVMEGLHLNNCTSCGAEMMSPEERSKIIDVLNQEKLELASVKTAVVPEKPKRTKAYTITSGTGTNLFSEQDRLFQRIEKEKEREAKRKEVLGGLEESRLAETKEATEHDQEDPELRSAQERLEKLLHFQNTSDQRTKIIDNASDFSMSNDSNLWGSAQDRALMLKKQQRNIRRWEKLEQERRGRRDKVVIDLVIGKDGKVTMTEASRPQKKSHAADDEDKDEISDEEDLKDLEEIEQLKGSLAQTSKEKEGNLSSKIWDPEKDRKQFRRPVYIDDRQSVESSGEDQTISDGRNWKKRVQISQNDENSLEQNILAVL